MIPARTFTARATETSGYLLAPKTPRWIVWKPGMALITLPNPTSEAVLKIASRAPVVAAESDPGSVAITRRRWISRTARMPSVRATINDQVETTAFTSRVGKVRFRSASEYQPATDQEVRLKTKLAATTRTSGRTRKDQVRTVTAPGHLLLAMVAVPFSGRGRPAPGATRARRARRSGSPHRR